MKIESTLAIIFCFVFTVLFSSVTECPGQGRSKNGQFRTPLPKDRKTVIVELSYPHHSKSPALQILANGTILFAKQDSSEAFRYQMHPLELHLLLRQIIHKNKFFDLKKETFTNFERKKMAESNDRTQIKISLVTRDKKHTVHVTAFEALKGLAGKEKFMQQLLSIEEDLKLTRGIALAKGKDNFRKIIEQINTKLHQQFLNEKFNFQSKHLQGAALVQGEKTLTFQNQRGEGLGLYAAFFKLDAKGKSSLVILDLDFFMDQ